MARFGFHASHEQFTPRDLLDWTRRAEQAGFDCAMSSDHFHPWSERQAQSGFAWSWIGAALEATRFPVGIISAPGYRYHPAVIAQGAATLAQMYPGRVWLALGSGEAINEAITGLPWPDKQERNARLKECAEIIHALFAGETVTHRGRVTVLEAKLYSRPETPPLLLGAAVTKETAEWVSSWADGLITTAGPPDHLRNTLESFRCGGGEDKPVHLQVALSWAASEDQAEREALHQWGSVALGGEPAWDLRRPKDFDAATRFVRGEDICKSVLVSADLQRHQAWLAEYAAMGFAEMYLHQVARDQRGFIDAFGTHVLPALRQEFGAQSSVRAAGQEPGGVSRFADQCEAESNVMSKTPITAERLRHEIDSGRTGDKIPHPDPAAAPLGADDEAGGHPPLPHQIEAAAAAELSRSSAPAPKREVRWAWLLIGFIVLLAAAALIWARYAA
jgi:coenzyme F420-dependent glucose-6-phosphate dehydrogenase